MACCRSSGSDSRLHCSHVWIHEEKLPCEITCVASKTMKSMARDAFSLPAPAFHGLTAWGDLGSRPWRVNLAQIAGRYIWHHSCSLVPVAFSGHHRLPTPEHRASHYPCCATNSRPRMSQGDFQGLQSPVVAVVRIIPLHFCHWESVPCHCNVPQSQLAG